jgi:hypothetical protein
MLGVRTQPCRTRRPARSSGGTRRAARAQAGGFQWVDDLTHYGAHRWGWASEAPGDVLELVVRAGAPARPHPPPALAAKDRTMACNAVPKSMQRRKMAALSLTVRHQPERAAYLRMCVIGMGRSAASRCSLYQAAPGTQARARTGACGRHHAAAPPCGTL